MSKKDYIAIANALKDAKKSLMYAPVNVGEINRTISIITDNLTAIFRIDNPNFDNTRFYSYLESDKRYKDFTDR